jgi:hypothetical protein
LTAIACIDAAGGKLPIWVLCRGKTAKCEERYRSDEELQGSIRRGELILSHEINAWTNIDVACEYRRWVRSRFSRDPIVVVWDLDTAHRSATVQALALELGIRLEFIPSGMTGELQPLDRRIFGNLKARARRRFDDQWVKDHDMDMQRSVQILVDAWRSISQDEIRDAWDLMDE